MMTDLKARIGDRASTENGVRGHVLPSDAVGPKSLLTRMGLDLGNAEIETAHRSASPHSSTQSDSLIRRLAIPIPNNTSMPSIDNASTPRPRSRTRFSSVSVTCQ